MANFRVAQPPKIFAERYSMGSKELCKHNFLLWLVSWCVWKVVKKVIKVWSEQSEKLVIVNFESS